MALLHVNFYSRTLERETQMDVILPEAAKKLIGMEGVATRQCRTLYLLHGMSDDQTTWQRRTSIERYAAAYGLAVVMPTTELGWYTDMYRGEKYFTFITRELPAKMRAFLPLSERREDTFIAGFSMGGYGALKIGLARPTQYAAIGCISAGVSNNTPDTVALRELRTGGRPLKDTEEDVPASIARAAALGKDAPHIYHTIGQEDFLLSGARETRDLLHSYPGDPFHYIYEEKPGKHGWEFCDGALRDFLQWLSPAPR